MNCVGSFFYDPVNACRRIRASHSKSRRRCCCWDCLRFQKKKKGGYYRISFRCRLKRTIWAWQPFRRQSHHIISQHWISFLSHPLLRFNSPEVVFWVSVRSTYERTQKPSNDLGVTAFKYLVDQPREETS